jgi:hypothetical protein
LNITDQDSPIKDFLCAEKYWEYIRKKEERETKPFHEREKLYYNDYVRSYGGNQHYGLRNHYKFVIEGLKTKRLLTERTELGHKNLPEYMKPLDNIDYHQDLDNIQWNDALNLTPAQLLDTDLTDNFFTTKIKKNEHLEKYVTEYTADEYASKLTVNELIIGNLPKRTTAFELKDKVKNFAKPVSIKMKRDILGNPAFYKLEFRNAEEMQKVKRYFENMKVMRGRVISLITKEASHSENQENRTIVVYNLDKSLGFADLVEDFSQWGSVMRMQVPLEYSNPVLPKTSKLISQLKRINFDFYDIDPANLNVIELDGDSGARKINFDNNDFETFTKSYMSLNDFHNQNYIDNKYGGNLPTDEFDRTYQHYLNKTKQINFYCLSDNFESKKQEDINEIEDFLEKIDGSSLHFQQNLLDQFKIPEDQNSIMDSENQNQNTQESAYGSLKEGYSTHDLFGLGSTNKGYAFLTYASVFEAKQALIHYKPDMFEAPPKTYDSVLKLATNHMDWDKKFFLETLRKIEIKIKTNEQKLMEKVHQAEKDYSQDEIREKYRKQVSKNYYKEILAYEQSKTEVQLDSTYSPKDQLQNEEQRVTRARSDIKKTLNKIYEVETRQKYTTAGHNLDTTFAQKNDYDFSDTGRNFEFEPNVNFKADFVTRLYQPKFGSEDSKLRVDPELVGLRDRLGNFDKELVDEEYEK